MREATIVIAALVLTGCVRFEDGLDAYNQGDYARALKRWQVLADFGDPAARNHLGVMFDHGQGVAEDDVEAVRLFRMAAEAGHAPAFNNLGLMYQRGAGVRR